MPLSLHSEILCLYFFFFLHLTVNWSLNHSKLCVETADEPVVRWSEHCSGHLSDSLFDKQHCTTILSICAIIEHASKQYRQMTLPGCWFHYTFRICFEYLHSPIFIYNYFFTITIATTACAGIQQTWTSYQTSQSQVSGSTIEVNLVSLIRSLEQ